MLGVKFKLPNKTDTFLSKIFKNIGHENRFWHIIEHEIYINCNEELFNKNVYSEKTFKKIIMEKDYYIIYSKIQLSDSKKTNKISNYTDFLKSDCILIAFITDSEYAQIYAKNDEYLEQIKNNIKQNSFSDFEIIKNTNIRNEFSAYTD